MSGCGPSMSLRICDMISQKQKGAGQPVHTCSLISTIVIHCLDCILTIYNWNFKLMVCLPGLKHWETYFVITWFILFVNGSL